MGPSALRGCLRKVWKLDTVLVVNIAARIPSPVSLAGLMYAHCAHMLQLLHSCDIHAYTWLQVFLTILLSAAPKESPWGKGMCVGITFPTALVQTYLLVLLFTPR